MSLKWGTASFEEAASGWRGTSKGFTTEANLAAATPGGAVTFRFQDEEGSFTANLNATAWTLPTPSLVNYAATQTIDPTKPFTFQWTQLTQNPSTDFTLLQIVEELEVGEQDVFGTVPCELVFQFPATAFMDPAATAFTLPANILTNAASHYAVRVSVSRYQGYRQGSGALSWFTYLMDQKSTVIPLGIRRAGIAVPTIKTQPPASVHETAGQSVMLHVEGIGTGPLIYQWYKDGAALHTDFPHIASVTGPDLQILDLRESDAGRYRVRVRNSGGEVESASSVLAVQPSGPGTHIIAKLSLNRGTDGISVLAALADSSGIVTIEASFDLVNWAAWSTNPVTAGKPLPIPLPFPSTGRKQFFRSAVP